MTDRAEMAAALEAVLFASSDPVSRARLVEIFDPAERDEAALALDEVLERFAPDAGRGIVAEEVAGGVRLVTRPELSGWLRRFFEASAGSKLSMAALETLAIVAYHQPVTAPEIQELRSVNPSGVLKTLLERRLVRIAGRKEVVGKPFLYTTTREFLVHFGLKSLQDLPPLEEFEEALAMDAADAGEEPPADGGLGGGDDREETILRRAADLEESDETEEAEPRGAEASEEPEPAEAHAGEPGAPEAEPARPAEPVGAGSPR
jgi:segregation and condensation protein B